MESARPTKTLATVGTRSSSQLGAQYLPLSKFYGTSKRINDAGMDKLLSLLQANIPKVRPELLGVIGQEHLFKMLYRQCGA